MARAKNPFADPAMSPELPYGDVEPGQELGGRYQLVEPLSNTHDITLWEGWDDTLSRSVLIWVIPPHHQRTDVMMTAARAAASASDTHFLRVLDALEAGPIEPVSCVVTEYVPGVRYEEVLRSGPLSGPAAAWIAMQLAAALAPLHARDLFHQRLSPASVILTPAGDVCISGFLLEAALTRPLEYVGMEQPPSRGEQQRADLDALGQLFYAGLCGRWPLLRSYERADLYGLPLAPRAPNNLLLPPSQLVAGVSPELETVCMQTLEPQPGSSAIRRAADLASVIRRMLGRYEAGDEIGERVRALMGADASAAAAPGGAVGDVVAPVAGADASVASAAAASVAASGGPGAGAGRPGGQASSQPPVAGSDEDLSRRQKDQAATTVDSDPGAQPASKRPPAKAQRRSWFFGSGPIAGLGDSPVAGSAAGGAVAGDAPVSSVGSGISGSGTLGCGDADLATAAIGVTTLGTAPAGGVRGVADSAEPSSGVASTLEAGAARTDAAKTGTAGTGTTGTSGTGATATGTNATGTNATLIAAGDADIVPPAGDVGGNVPVLPADAVPEEELSTQRWPAEGTLTVDLDSRPLISDVSPAQPQLPMEGASAGALPPRPHLTHSLRGHAWWWAIPVVVAVALVIILVKACSGPSGPTGPGPVAIVTAYAFDPKIDGGDGQENSDKAVLAVDGDASTAWTSETYLNNPKLGGLKPGVGLVLDLGQARTVTQVTLTLGAEPVTFEVRVPKTDPSASTPVMDSQSQWTPVASATADKSPYTVTLTTPTSTRWVLVYFTSLAEVSSKHYEAIVDEVQVDADR